MLKIYNSLTKKKEIFKPITPGKVTIYLCGMTVYDYCHIGHARSWIVFDVIIQYLRSQGFEVIYVHNITDVDDKIINRANQNNESVEAVTERFIAAFHDDEKALNLQRPEHEPRATEYIPQIIQLIQTLIDKGSAYVGDNGDVYFDVRRFKEYGKLSKRDLDTLRAGARVEISESKHDPLDFVLWKLAKPNEPKWDSPWGEGRPGWHIECSAMSTALLGQPFDIHGGGMDLKFPHHENEIAQSEAAIDKPFVNIWMHVGLLQINQEKMSKSLNNFFTIREVLAEHHSEIVHYFLLSGHYRSPINYSKENIANAYHALSRLYTAIRDLPRVQEKELGQPFEARFHAAMEDDFNTPETFAVLFDLAREINRCREQEELEKAAELAATLKRLTGIFGFLQSDPDTFLKGAVATNEVQTIEKLLTARHQARAEKNWAEADRIRAQLTEMGIVIEDATGGTTWRRKG